MRSKVIDRILGLNVWIAAVYSLFSAVSLYVASDSLVSTPRHAYIFDNVLSQEGFSAIYVGVAVFLIISLFHKCSRVYSLTLISILSLFWAGVAVIPFLTGVVSQGNLLGSLASILLAVYTLSLAVLCWYAYNKHELDTPAPVVLD